MKPTQLLAILLLAIACPLAAAQAQNVYTVTPASPQPDAAALKPGLSVKYAYPGDVKSLHEAEGWRSYGPKAGPPLIGFDYADTLPEEKALTSDSVNYVVAFINGYMKFDKPGAYQLEFHSNDGLRVKISGVQVFEYDGRHPCEPGQRATVQVPEAGWYPVEALFFQRVGTSCMLLNWAPPGEAWDWAPLEIYGYIEE
tara:strand:- start:1094 stop:1687 length:594 start_codon:yes stop_codon:yes gene_type:complete